MGEVLWLQLAVCVSLSAVELASVQSYQEPGSVGNTFYFSFFSFILFFVKPYFGSSSVQLSEKTPDVLKVALLTSHASA